MKQIVVALLTSTAVAVAVGPAVAADTATPAPVYTKAPAAAPIYDWSGLFIGGHGSYSWTSSDSTMTNTATGVPFAPVSTSNSSWHGGGQIGYDYMLPSRVVLGIVADVSSGNSTTTTNVGFGETTVSQGKALEVGTVRGRFGYAIDNVLLYGTAGWAWSNDQPSRTQLLGQVGNAVAGTTETENIVRSGWTAGAGVAYAFAQNWNVFAEYQYTNLPSMTVTFPLAQRSVSTSMTASTIEFGLNFKFNWGTPVVPVRY